MTGRRVWPVVAVMVGAAFGAPHDVAQGSAAGPSLGRDSAPLRRAGTDTPAVAAVTGPAPALTAAADELELVIRSRIVAAPSYVRSRVRLAPHPAQQVLRVTVDSPGFARTIEVALSGDGAPDDCRFYWRDLPPGLYDMVATVHDGAGAVLSRRQVSFAVVGREPAG